MNTPATNYSASTTNDTPSTNDANQKVIRIPRLVSDAAVGGSAGIAGGIATVVLSNECVRMASAGIHALQDAARPVLADKSISTFATDFQSSTNTLDIALNAANAYIQSNPATVVGLFALGGLAICAADRTKNPEKRYATKIVKEAKKLAGIGTAVGVKAAAVSAGGLFGAVAGYISGVAVIAAAKSKAIPDAVSKGADYINGGIAATVKHGVPQEIGDLGVSGVNLIPSGTEMANAFVQSNASPTIACMTVAGIYLCATWLNHKATPVAIRAGSKVSGQNLNRLKYLR